MSKKNNLTKWGRGRGRGKSREGTGDGGKGKNGQVGKWEVSEGEERRKEGWGKNSSLDTLVRHGLSLSFGCDHYQLS